MKESRAEYFKKYRATSKALKQRKFHQEGVNDGVGMCSKFLREVIGERQVTGLRAANLVDKTLGMPKP